MMNKGQKHIFHIWRFSRAISVIICLLLFFLIRTPPAFAAPRDTGSYNDLDNDASQWEIFHDQEYALGTVLSSPDPSLDGNGLQVHLLPGWPYAGLHVYRNLPAVNSATSFAADYSFYFPTLNAMQGLEFMMNKWASDQRWEWALQWQIVPDGSAQQGPPNSWRLWDGQHWENTGVIQDLQPNTWHTLHLTGDIVDGHVHYLGFICDDLSTNLQSQSFAPVSSPGEKLAIALQLDGDITAMPYKVYFDHVNMQWQ